MVRHWSNGPPPPPSWPEELLDAIPPVGVILVLCIGCWAVVILAGWALWEFTT
jgi:hypothetical protein